MAGAAGPSDHGLAMPSRRRSSRTAERTKNNQKKAPGQRQTHSTPTSSHGPKVRKPSAGRRRPSKFKTESPPNSLSRETPFIMQRSARSLGSPRLTKTGRPSRAKKGLSVHECLKCRKVYTRAEHLRRHQANHEPPRLRCPYANCQKVFQRDDLLQRHQERHNEAGDELAHGSSNASETSVAASCMSPGAGLSVAGAAKASAVTLEANEPSSYIPHIGGMSSSMPMPRLDKPFTSGVSAELSAELLHPVPTAPPLANPFGLGAFSGCAWPSSSDCSSASGYESPRYEQGPAVSGATPYYYMSHQAYTSSSTSFNAPWQPYPSNSHSPVSDCSSNNIQWASGGESLLAAQAAVDPLGFYNTASSSSSLVTEQTPTYVPFDESSMPHYNARDEAEWSELFPQNSLGLGSGPDNTEQHLANYWKFFHPCYPILHQPTFNAVAASPLLKASMMVIGALYSDQTSAKCEAKSLHGRCLKIVAQRQQDVHQAAPQPRLCDQQAVFLLEFYSQFKSRRLSPVAARALSNTFETMFYQLSADHEARDFYNTIEPEPGLNGGATHQRWFDWVRLSSKQRLLVAAFILRAQKAGFLAHDSGRPVFQVIDLPFPCSEPLWNAISVNEWASIMRSNPSRPRSIAEALEDLSSSPSNPYGTFQSTVLITYWHNIHDKNLYFPLLDDTAFEGRLDQSYGSRIYHHATLVSQSVPLRALLAVSGESWILNETVDSESFAVERQNLRMWLDGCWASENHACNTPVAEAVKHSVHVLHLCFQASAVEPTALPLQWEIMGHISVLVLWAVAYRVAQRYLPGTRLGTAFQALGSAAHMTPTLPSTSAGHDEIVRDFFVFANEAMNAPDFMGRWHRSDLPLLQWRTGVAALLQWVKTRLLDSSRDQKSRSDVLSAAVNTLSRLNERGWEPDWF